MKARPTVSREFKVKRWHGNNTGEYGVPCFQEADGDAPRMYGVSPEAMLGEVLFEGAVVRVTVELVKQGRARASRGVPRWNHDSKEWAHKVRRCTAREPGKGIRGTPRGNSTSSRAGCVKPGRQKRGGRS